MTMIKEKNGMAEINLLDTHPKANRDYDKRASEKTPEIVHLAKQFGLDFFDGDRKWLRRVQI